MLQQRDRTSPPLRNAPAFFPGTLRCQYPPKQSAETRGGNLLLLPLQRENKLNFKRESIMIIVRLLSPEPVGWLQHHQLYSGVGADIVMESIALVDWVPSPNACFR